MKYAKSEEVESESSEYGNNNWYQSKRSKRIWIVIEDFSRKLKKSEESHFSRKFVVQREGIVLLSYTSHLSKAVCCTIKGLNSVLTDSSHPTC